MNLVSISCGGLADWGFGVPPRPAGAARRHLRHLGRRGGPVGGDRPLRPAAPGPDPQVSRLTARPLDLEPQPRQSGARPRGSEVQASGFGLRLFQRPLQVHPGPLDRGQPLGLLGSSPFAAAAAAANFASISRSIPFTTSWISKPMGIPSYPNSSHLRSLGACRTSDMKLRRRINTRQIRLETHSAGLEPATLGSEDRCSIQLSYECSAGTAARQRRDLAPRTVGDVRLSPGSGRSPVMPGSALRGCSSAGTSRGWRSCSSRACRRAFRTGWTAGRRSPGRGRADGHAAPFDPVPHQFGGADAGRVHRLVRSPFVVGDQVNQHVEVFRDATVRLRARQPEHDAFARRAPRRIEFAGAGIPRSGTGKSWR